MGADDVGCELKLAYDDDHELKLGVLEAIRPREWGTGE